MGRYQCPRSLLGLGCLMPLSTIFQLYRGWQSVLFVKKTRLLRENHWPAANHWQTLSHNVVSSTTRYEQDSSSQLVVVIGTDCTGSCKSNYQTMTTTDIYINFNIHCTCIYRHEGHDVQYNFLKEIHGPIWAEKYLKKKRRWGYFHTFWRSTINLMSRKWPQKIILKFRWNFYQTVL